MSSFSGTTFVLIRFRFRLYAFIEAAALRSIVLRYSCAPTATRNYLTTVCGLFCLCFRDVIFSEYFCTIAVYLCMESTSYVFPSGWCFSALRPRAGFLTLAYVRNQSINQPCTKICIEIVSIVHSVLKLVGTKFVSIVRPLILLP